MSPVESAIWRFRRDLTIGAMVRGVLVTGALVCILFTPSTGSGFNGALTLTVIGAIWLTLAYRSMKDSRLTAESPYLIATGRFDEAETRIDAALKSFSIFKPTKLVSLHHLAMLRHAQKRWQESALLCGALLTQRTKSLGGLSKPTMLLLVDNLLHVGDLNAAYAALGRLHRLRLNLAETMALEQLQLEYLARVQAFEPMLSQVKTKVQMAELMPAGQAARTQAYLALAAKKSGRNELSQWLKGRAELLVDPPTLVAERPILAELWPS